MKNDIMTNDELYRKLEFFKTTNKKVHLNIIAGADKGCWRNGFVLDVSLDKRCFIIIDDVLGERPYLFEEVDVGSIVPYQKKGGEDGAGMG